MLKENNDIKVLSVNATKIKVHNKYKYTLLMSNIGRQLLIAQYNKD